MQSMFDDCNNITILDLSNFDTSSVTNMRAMFSGCSSLTNLNLKNFDTSNVTDMSYMFSSFSSLTTLDLSNFNTSNVTNMYWMFNRCSSLTALDLSNFNTSKVTNMGGMFAYNSSLTTLDLSNFDTSNVKYMNDMFFKCRRLNYLDIRNFDFSSVENINSLFYFILLNTTIYVKDETSRTWILSLSSGARPSSWTEDNILIPTPTIELNKQPGTYTGRQLIEISPSKWYTKDVNYLYCISSDNKECIPTLVGIDTETINLKPGNNYKICATTSGNKVSNTWCTDTYRVKKENYEVGDAIYYNPVDNKICLESDYQSDNSLNYYKGEADSGNGEGCMKWYVIANNENDINLLLDHNTTNKVA